VVAPAPAGGSSIDEILARARARLRRVSPAQAWEAVRAGALLVDTRPQAQRAVEGVVPGALLVERNVLEWRFDPRSDAKLPAATGYGVHLIVMCSQGYSSSLAAASLQDLGLVNATDLIGGFQAWEQAGLPTAPGPGPAGQPPAPPGLPPGVPAPPGIPAQPPEVAVT
jgi:rhodanese-related sulfurtransferase